MITIKKAILDNTSNIVELIIEGAKAGSFDPNVLEESMRDFLEKDIESIIVHGRRTDEDLEAYALIFQDKEKFVGFVIISDMPPQLPGLELYGYYLIQSYRGRGHGKKLLETMMKRVQADCKDFYVRCRPDATVMYRLVENAGFSNIGTTESGAHILHKVLEDKIQEKSQKYNNLDFI